MKRLSLSLLLALAGGAFVLADTLTLKDGTKIEGKIVSETAEAYTVMVQVTSSIKDERTIKKEDVASIDKSGPDDIAFKEIEKLLPAPDRLTAEQYAERIGRVKAFLNVYPTSMHASSAKAMITKLEAERNLAADGGLKLEGRWISEADRAANAYEIDARLLISDMKDAADEQRFQAALLLFDKIEEEFSASEQFEDAAALARQVLAAYKPIVADLLARVDERTKQRELGLQRLSPGDRAAEEAAMAASAAAYEKRNAQEKADRVRWMTLDPFDKTAAQTVLRNIDNALSKLDNPPSGEQKKAGPIYRQAWAAALAENVEEGKKLVGELRGLRVPARYIEALEAKLEPPEVTPIPTDPAPTTNPEPEPEPEPAPEPKPEPKPADPPKATGTPGDGDSGEASTGDSSSDDEAEEGGGFPIQIVLVVVLVVVIAGALLAAFGGKKK